MINKNHVPIKKNRGIDHDELMVYCGFSVVPFVKESDLFGSTLQLSYKSITFEDVSRTFVTTFAHLLLAYSKSLLEIRKYSVNESLTLKPVQVDDHPALRCVIRYYENEHAREIKEEEVFLDRAEAFTVSKNIIYALNLGKTLTIRAS